jgi:hypothetical protein
MMFSDLIDRLKNDRVELVFGILTIVGMLIVVATIFYDFGRFFGMNRLIFTFIALLGVIGVRTALQVVRVIRQFM